MLFQCHEAVHDAQSCLPTATVTLDQSAVNSPVSENLNTLYLLLKIEV